MSKRLALHIFEEKADNRGTNMIASIGIDPVDLVPNTRSSYYGTIGFGCHILAHAE